MYICIYQQKNEEMETQKLKTTPDMKNCPLQPVSQSKLTQGTEPIDRSRKQSLLERGFYSTTTDILSKYSPNPLPKGSFGHLSM